MKAHLSPKKLLVKQTWYDYSKINCLDSINEESEDEK